MSTNVLLLICFFNFGLSGKGVAMLPPVQDPQDPQDPKNSHQTPLSGKYLRQDGSTSERIQKFLIANFTFYHVEFSMTSFNFSKDNQQLD